MLNEENEEFEMLEPKTEIEESLSDYKSGIYVQTGISNFTQFDVNMVCVFNLKNSHSYWFFVII